MDVIQSLVAIGTTVLLTTHYMEEAQHLADRVIVLADGRMVADATPTSCGHVGPAGDPLPAAGQRARRWTCPCPRGPRRPRAHELP